jgi:selenocysteine-specific elongation factor
MRTLGGAIVLDPAPAKHKRFRADVLEAIALQESGGPLELVHEALRKSGLGGMTTAELTTARVVSENDLGDVLDRLAESGRAVALGEAWYDAATVDRAAADIRKHAETYQKANPLAWGIGRAELQERLGHRGARSRFGELLDGIARRSSAAETPMYVRPDAVRVGSSSIELTDADRRALETLEDLLRTAGTTPPLVSEMQARLNAGARFSIYMGMLEEGGRVVRIAEGVYYHRGAFDALETQLRAHLTSHPTMSMADFKDLTSLSRKYAVPLLEYFDRKGLTARQGDNRVRGAHFRAT